jgi:hypothetical protein
VSIVGFYFPGHDIKVDQRCQAPFLGNFWSPAVLESFAPPKYKDSPHTFNCSEAAYWACQWWDHAAEFEGLNGRETFAHQQNLTNRGIPKDPSFGGFGSEWQAMRAILAAKFQPGTPLAEGLIATNDAYLVEHQGLDGLQPNGTLDSDNVWSDYCTGEGSNHLGLQLMALRDDLLGKGRAVWRETINSVVDMRTGKFRDEATWKSTSRHAARALNLALPFTCPPHASGELYLI